jgi:hypothetical protein
MLSNNQTPHSNIRLDQNAARTKDAIVAFVQILSLRDITFRAPPPPHRHFVDHLPGAAVTRATGARQAGSAPPPSPWAPGST